MKRKLLATLLALCLCFALLPTAVLADAPGTYHTGDIAVINRMITDNKPEGMTTLAPTDGSLSPEDWKNIVGWDYSTTPRRVISLDLQNKDLSGTLDLTGLSALKRVYCNNNGQMTGINVSGLPALDWLECRSNQLSELDVNGLTTLIKLDCSSNQLTELDLSGLTALTTLGCGVNQLTELDVSGLTALTDLECSFNQLKGTLDVSNLPNLTRLLCISNLLTAVKLNGTAQYQAIFVLANLLKDTSAVTGAEINWDDNDFMFDPQHPTVTNSLSHITSDNAATHYLLTINMPDYTATLTADKGYALPDEIVVRVADRVLTRDKDYTYDSTSGKLTIFGESIRGEDPPSTIGDIVIEGSGVPVPIYSVSIETEGKGSASATPISGPAGTVITLVASADSGWEFLEWQVVSGGVGISENKFKMPNNNVVIKAVFKEKPAEPTEPTEPVKPTEPDQSLPATGENAGIYLWASLLLFAVSALLLALRKKRMSEQSD